MTPGGRRPFVSVIVPVLNDRSGVEVCLPALLAQTHPADRYEILVVDNGSTDGTRAAVERFRACSDGRVRLLEEPDVRSSYAARNRGLRAARGEIVAFTDADCDPQPTWLERGLLALEAQGRGSVAGRVRFTYRGARPNVFEYWDSAVHLNQERLARHFGYGATANLFVYASLFERHGPFRPELLSGGDKELGHRLRLAGEPVSYAAEAVVCHRARATLGAAFAKSLRRARAHRSLHRLGVLASRRRCARRLGRLLTCPRPGSWEGRLPWPATATAHVLRNADAWLSVAVCLAQGARERVDIWLAPSSPRVVR